MEKLKTTDLIDRYVRSSAVSGREAALGPYVVWNLQRVIAEFF
jgi:hypothetical protein